MDNITLDVESSTNEGSVHARLHINGKDVGVLYLTTEEHDILVNTLRASTTDVNVWVNTPDDGEEIDYDVFDD